MTPLLAAALLASAQDPLEPAARLEPVPFWHEATVRAAALSADGKALLSLDAEGFLTAWERSSARRLSRRKILDPVEHPPRMSCSRDGSRVLLALAGAARIFDPATGAEIRRVENCRSPLLSDDGRILAAPEGKSIRRWEIAGGAGLARLSDGEAEIHRVAISPDGKTLAASFLGASGFALWDVETGRQTFRTAAHPTGGMLSALAFSADGRTLAAGDAWGVNLWKVADGSCLWNRSREAFAWSSLRFSNDGKRIVSSRGERFAVVWDIASDSEAGRWRTASASSEFLGAAGSGDFLVRVDGSAVRLEEIAGWGEGGPRRAGVSWAGFASDGRAVTGALDGRVRFWDAATGRDLESLSGPPGHELRALSADGKRALVREGESAARMWDLVSGKELLKAEGKAILLDCSPDGGTIALVTHATTLSLWGLAQGRERVQVRAEGAITAFAFSLDGKAVGWGELSGALVIAESARGRELLRFRPRGKAVTALALARNGAAAATGDEEGEIRLWEAEAGKEPVRVGIVSGRASAVALSPDARWVAAGGPHGYVRLFRAPPGEERTLYGRAHSGPVTSLAFSGDGRHLISGGADGIAHVWRVPGEK